MFHYSRRVLAIGLVLCGTFLSWIGISVAYAAKSDKERRPAPEYLTGILTDLPAAIDQLEPHSPVIDVIKAGKLEAAREMLTFRPLAEAPIPKDFPAFTPVGVIEVKQYPAYRKAVGKSFWPLFRHIQKQNIPMTAPVEMKSSPSSKKGQMAFLYETTEVGNLGEIDGVEVQETPATLVASLGVRGKTNKSMTEQAKATLEKWLVSQSKYQRAAEDETAFRLYGYNSPMVSNSEKYWEAQMLIKVQ